MYVGVVLQSRILMFEGVFSCEYIAELSTYTFDKGLLLMFMGEVLADDSLLVSGFEFKSRYNSLCFDNIASNFLLKMENVGLSVGLSLQHFNITP